MVNLSPRRSGLKGLLEAALDKGVAVDCSVQVGLCCDELLGVRSNMMLSSFRGAEKTGSVFPSRTNVSTPTWQASLSKVSCPVCRMESRKDELKGEGCPWCGWVPPEKRERNDGYNNIGS